MEGEGEPAEITHLIRDLRTAGEDFVATGEWLANAMQDLKVEYGNTVRDASKKIVQFEYGEDGIDVSKSENGKINVKRIIESLK